MKTILTILGILNGGFMFVDGIFVMLKGKYIGSDKPGPWAHIFYKFNVNVFKLGPLFIALGLLWLLWTYALITHQTWAYLLGLLVSVVSIWYLPIGTLISATIILILVTSKAKLGL